MSGLQITAEQREQLERITKSSQRHAGWWRSGTIAEILLANAAPAASEPLTCIPLLVKIGDSITISGVVTGFEERQNGDVVTLLDCDNGSRVVIYPERETKYVGEPSATPEPLRVQVGKWYERGNGEVRHIVKVQTGTSLYPFVDDYCNCYDQTGLIAHGSRDLDLIREVPAPPIARRSDPFPSQRATYTCGCEAGGHLVSASCPIHNEPEVPAPVPVVDRNDPKRLPEEIKSELGDATPKFKVGDRVTTTAVDDAGVGTVIEIVNERNIRVKFDNKIYDECIELVYDLHLDTTPRTVELFDGAAFVYGIGKHQFRVRKLEGRWYACESDGVHSDIGADLHSVGDLLQSYQIIERDHSRDQHPVGSEWVTKDGSRFSLVFDKPTLRYALLVFMRGSEHSSGEILTWSGWHKEIKDATCGARRADVVSVEVA